MYELPELEVIKALIAEKYAGAIITKIICNTKTITGKKTKMCEELQGATIWFVERRAGHLVLHLDSGKRLVIYLAHSSTFYGGEAGEALPSSRDFVVQFGDRYMAFGKLPEQAIQLITVREVEELLKACALDPLDKRFTLDYLWGQLQKKRSSLKTFLLDASVMSGIGAVYSDEILFAAKLHPARKANSLNKDEAAQFYEAIRETLKAAIADGGMRIQPLYAHDSLTGSYSDKLAVFGRDGQNALDSNDPVELISVAKQKCYVCPTQQTLSSRSTSLSS